MSIRGIYWVLLIGLSLALLFQWTSEKREESVVSTFWMLKPLRPIQKRPVSIENNELYVLVSVATGNIETRIKEYPVENVEGSAYGFW